MYKCVFSLNFLFVLLNTQLSRLPWLEAWLQNIMTDVPELGVCHHDNGVLKGYEYLSTSEICSVKQTSAYIVQQNAHQILSFLRSNCKDDPGLYWVKFSLPRRLYYYYYYCYCSFRNWFGLACVLLSTALPKSRWRCDSTFSFFIKEPFFRRGNHLHNTFDIQDENWLDVFLGETASQACPVCGKEGIIH